MTAWRSVVGFEGRYEVSDDGQVRVLAAPGRGRFNQTRVLKIQRGPRGYWQVILYAGNGARARGRAVHNLMLEAFVGPKPEGAYGLHADDDRNNNHLLNLRWGTPSQNTLDMVANGSHNHARQTHCKWGHPLEGDNLILTARQRACRACARRRNAEYRARKHALGVYAIDTEEAAA